MTETTIATGSSLLSSFAMETVQNLPHRKQLVEGSEEEKQLTAEVDELFANRNRAGELLRTLFPDGVPVDLSFYNRLDNLRTRLGWGDVSHRVTGLLWSMTLQSLTADASEALLRAFLAVDGQYFFLGLNSLAVPLKEHELRAEFAVDLFGQLVHRIGNDLASGGFWEALTIYCEAHLRSALKMLRVLLPSAPDDSKLAVAGFVLGVVRTLPKETPASNEFRKLEAGFATQGDTKKRSAYHRSWIRTAWRGKMTAHDLSELIERMEKGTPDEFQEAFGVVFSSMLITSLDAECMRIGLAWLHAKTSPTIPPIAKFQVVDFVTSLAEQERRNAGERRTDCRDLLLAVQPVPEEDKGTWKRTECFRVRELRRDLDEFGEFCLTLADRNAESWLKVLREPRGLEWLLSEMTGKAVDKMVGRMILSPDASTRELGLFFFDRLGLASLPAELLEEVGEEQLRVAFHELQRISIHGAAIARYLIAFLGCVGRASQALQEDYYEELVLQAQNYPGVCREEFQRRVAVSPLLKKALDEVEAYFEALRKVSQSTINSMEVPGYSQAMYLYRRRFSNEVLEKAKQASVLLSFIKSVRVLYGKSWSSYSDGNFTTTSSLKPVSQTIEVPRLEMIDPEDMALRRLHASARIGALSATRDRADNPE